MRRILLLTLATLLAMGAACAAIGEALVIEDVEMPPRPADAAPLDSENDMTLLQWEETEEDVVPINRAHFPDAAFRARVAADLDGNGDGVLSERERKAVTIDVSGKGISNLKGIEYFPALKYLYFSDNAVSSVDLSGNAQLLEVDGSRNRLRRVDLDDNRMLRYAAFEDNRLQVVNVKRCKKLVHLDVSGNAIAGLDLSWCENLKYLDVSDNLLNRLRLMKNRKLQELYCNDNSLKQLDLKKNAQLTRVIAADNLLTSVDVSGCNQLKSLDVRDNTIRKLNVSGKARLEELHCEVNQIGTLNVSGCGKLATLLCADNRLSALDAGDCRALASLDCARNRIKSLNVDGCGKLATLSCADNQLTALDVGACRMLKSLDCARNQLAALDFGANPALTSLHCQENRLRRLDVRNNAMLDALACWGNDIGIFDLAALPDGLRALASNDALRVEGADMTYWRADAPKELSFPAEVTLMDGDAFVCGQDYVFDNLNKLRSNARENYPTLSDADFANFRVVATTGMGRNALFRSSSPITGSLRRNEEAAAAMEAARVRTILNLSDNVYEMVQQGYYHGSYYAAQNVLAIHIVGYSPGPSRMERYVDAIRYMLQHDGPYLTHCIYGQDRTGVLCALLECLMGASPDEVVDDYMQSYANFYGVVPGTALYDLIVNERIRDHLIQAFDGVDILLGEADPAACAEDLLMRYGMTEEEIAALKARLAKDY